ncbi:MAG: iron-containing alcohol dehydrogenase, partial [Terriglobia bacterium]
MERQGSKRAATLWVRTPTARYPVWVASGLLRRCGRRLRELRPGARRVFVVSSPRVWALWGSELAHSLRAARLQTETVLFTDAEENKRTRTVEKLAEQLLARGADRNAVLLALGGSVVGDVTGFLAA